MQPDFHCAIPDATLAVFAVYGGKPHQGLRGANPALYPVREACNSTVLLGLRGQVELNRIGSCCTGKERDSESGNDYFGARYYASSMGRWLSADWSAKAEPVPYAKLGEPQSLNLYAYASNNPLANVDLDGHFSCGGGNANQIGCVFINVWDENHGIVNGEAHQQSTLPGSPAGLGDGWKDVTPAKRPAGKPRRYKGPKGTEIEFDPGVSGEPGWGGKDHWHEVDPATGKRVGKHLAPGVPMPGPDGVVEPEPAPQAPEPSSSPFSDWMHDQWQGFKNYLRDHPYGPNSSPGPYVPPLVPTPLPLPW